MTELEVLEIRDEILSLLPELKLEAWQAALIRIALKVVSAVIINKLNAK